MGARASRDSDGNEEEEAAEDDVTGHSRRSSVDAQEPPNRVVAPVLEPRRHQGERGIDLLNILEDLYRTGQLRMMPPQRQFLR